MSEHDAPGSALLDRLDSIERRLDGLRDELAEVRSLASTAAEASATASVAPEAPVAQQLPPTWGPAPARVAAPPPRLVASSPPPPAPPAPPPPQAPVAAPGPPVHPPRTLPSVGDVVERWQLFGPRGFAIVGGAVTALGIGLLFILATNRGWIGPAERVALGAIASALVFGSGLALRARYGQLLAAFAAVGAGAAGAYATLAAATARYDLVPDPLALPLAGAVAAATTAVALAWGSQILAGIGLVGSALAPALQAIDTGMTPGSAAFAVIVLAATAVLAARRDWQPLLAVVAAIVLGQTLVLVADTDWAGDVGAVSTGLALAATLLGAGILLRHRRGAEDLAPLAATLPLAGTGIALVTAARLLEHGNDRGVVLLAMGGAWAGAWLALQARDRALALVVGASSLALVAVATAELLSDDALALAWAAQAVLLSFLASRLRDARLQVGGLAYLVLAVGHALAVDAPPSMLFDQASAEASAAVVLAATSLAALGAALMAPATHAAVTETGVLAFLAAVRVFLEQRRTALRETLFLASGALGVLASAVLLTGLSFEHGHIAASGVGAVAAATGLALAARRRSTGLVVATLVALALVVGESAYDAAEFMGDADRSLGGWSMLLAAAGLLGGTFALRVLHSTPQRLGIVSGIAAFVALAWSTSALTLVVPRVDGLDPSESWLGLGLAVVALVYGALAGSVFGPGRLRNLSTVLWAHALVAALGAEGLLLQDGRAFAAAAAVSGGLLAVAALPLRELRLAFAGAIVIGVAGVATLAVVTPPERFLEANPAPADGLWVLVACLAGAAALVEVLRRAGRSEWRPVGIALGGLVLYTLSLGVLGLVVRVSGASLEADFERGHTVVSAVWAFVGLAGLVAGLVRSSSVLRLGGLGLFGVSLAKIFLYDLSELSSVARAASFIVVGAAILAGGAALQRLSARFDPHDGPAGSAT